MVIVLLTIESLLYNRLPGMHAYMCGWLVVVNLELNWIIKDNQVSFLLKWKLIPALFARRNSFINSEETRLLNVLLNQDRWLVSPLIKLYHSYQVQIRFTKMIITVIYTWKIWKTSSISTEINTVGARRPFVASK